MANYWWNSPQFKRNDPMMALYHSLFTISHLPGGEREAWRSFFDYYVFKREGEPLGHLPEKSRGILGEMKSEVYERIKAYVMANIRR